MMGFGLVRWRMIELVGWLLVSRTPIDAGLIDFRGNIQDSCS